VVFENYYCLRQFTLVTKHHKVNTAKSQIAYYNFILFNLILYGICHICMFLLVT